MPEPAQDVVNTLFKPLLSLSQAFSQAVPQLEQMAPHVVLEKLRLSLTAKPEAPPAPPTENLFVSPIHQRTNIGLYKQSQTVGQRARVGVLDDAGYMIGLSNIVERPRGPPYSETLGRQPLRVPSAVGVADIVATTAKGMAVEEIAPVIEAKDRFTLYAPAPKKIETSMF